MRPTNQLRDDLEFVLLAHRCEPSEKLMDAIFETCGAQTLTPRHGDVLRHALSGANDKQIAADLGIDSRTVELHWQQIRERLGIDSRLRIGAFLATSVFRR